MCPGAIVTGSCIKPGADMSECFRYFQEKVGTVLLTYSSLCIIVWLFGQVSMLSGGAGKVGYSQATYTCEYDSAWRNKAMTYIMEEAGVFPEGVDPDAALDFYIQVNTARSLGPEMVSFFRLAVEARGQLSVLP